MPTNKKFVDDSLDTYARFAKQWIDDKVENDWKGSAFPWTQERADEFGSIPTETLLFDDYFINGRRKQDGKQWLRPEIADIIIEMIYEWEHNGLDLAIVLGGFGVGKTVLASIIQWILHLKFSCMYDPASSYVRPQEYFELRPDDTVAFLSLSKTIKKAEEITFGAVKQSFDSQFNRDYFPVNPRIRSKLVIERNNTLIFPNTATEAANAGYNVYSAVIDEASFMEVVEDSARATIEDRYDQAEGAFRSTYGRMSSRFDDPSKKNGMIVMISSVNHAEDFLMRKVRQAYHGVEGADDLKVFYRILPPWDVMPRMIEERKKEYFYFDTETMEVIEDDSEKDFLDTHWVDRPHEDLVLLPTEEDSNWTGLRQYRKSQGYNYSSE